MTDEPPPNSKEAGQAPRSRAQQIDATAAEIVFFVALTYAAVRNGKVMSELTHKPPANETWRTAYHPETLGPFGKPGPSVDAPGSPISRSAPNAATNGGTPALPATEATAQPAAQPESASEKEALNKAEQGRKTLRERLAQVKDLTPLEQQQICRRLASLSGEALVHEMRAIEHALFGKNADRALNTYVALDSMMAQDSKANERLPSEIVEMLIVGVADSRTNSARGQSGILGARQAKESAHALLTMPEETHAHIKKLLTQAGQTANGNQAPGASAAAEQALILKAVAARRQQLTPGPQADGADTHVELVQKENQAASAKAVSEVTEFATQIRGMKHDDLINSTTLLDVDDKNTAEYDPDKPDSKDERNDNDGLYQKFTDSCVPTTAQIVKGEADPIYALRVHREGALDDDPNSETAKEQQSTLEAHGGTAVSRQAKKTENLLSSTLSKLRRTNEISDTQWDAIMEWFGGRGQTPEAQNLVNAALEKVRQFNGGHPTDAEIARMREDRYKQGYGTHYTDQVLHTVAGATTHIDYKPKQISKDGMNENLPAIDKLLKDGQTVPINIKYDNRNQHSMLISDVRPAADGRRLYLVSDPWSGATRLVSADSLCSGAFAVEQFGLPKATVTQVFVDGWQSITGK